MMFSIEVSKVEDDLYDIDVNAGLYREWKVT
jgi:hypothetical protein